MLIDVGLRFGVFVLVWALSGLLGRIVFERSPVMEIQTWGAGFVVACLAAWTVRLMAPWQRVIVLTLGRYSGVRGPGLFLAIPLIQSVSRVIDLRTITSTFRAEQAITADTVPVDVDAVLFWRVIDPEKAALEVVAYDQAVGWASQTAMRDVIGRSTLADILSGREQVDAILKTIIDNRTEPWGVRVESVEIRDVKIPPALQDAMSRQAQAERERQARIILAESETQIAAKFMEAAQLYEQSPTALHLRAMNMLYEGMKDKGSLIVVPSSALETMNLGSLNYAALNSQANRHLSNSPDSNSTPLPNGNSMPKPPTS
ncbi:MAG: slipin family protein [Armatimonadota bacterium]|nr:slipin family protein [Armatimonadota bacterium]